MSDAQCNHSNVQKRRYYSELNRIYFGDPVLMLSLSALLSKQFDTSWLAVRCVSDGTSMQYSTLKDLPISKVIREELVSIFRPSPEVQTVTTAIPIQLFMNVLTDVCTPLSGIVLGNDENDSVIWHRPREKSIPLTQYVVENETMINDLFLQLKEITTHLQNEGLRFPLLTLDMFEVVDGKVRICDCRTLISSSPQMCWKFMADLLKTDTRWDTSTSIDDERFVINQWNLFLAINKLHK